LSGKWRKGSFGGRKRRKLWPQLVADGNELGLSKRRFLASSLRFVAIFRRDAFC